MGRIHFVGGEKGGVGKSLTSRLLAQYLIDTGLPFRGFDSDRSHGTFSRFYSEYTQAVKADEFASLDEILAQAEEYPDAEIVVDLAAQTSELLQRWLRDSEVFEILDELGFKALVWHVMDDGVDCMNLLDSALDTFADVPVQFMVVMNKGRGDSFDYFLQSNTLRKAYARGAQTISLEKLEPRLTQKIDFNGLSYWAAANSREHMNIVERRRVGAWLRAHYEQFDRFLPRANAVADGG